MIAGSLYVQYEKRRRRAGTAPSGGRTVMTEEPYDPFTGPPPATMGGQTRTINVADVAQVISQSSGATYSQPGAFSTSDFETAIQEVARQTWGHVSKSTEPVTVTAGTFPLAARHSLTVSDPETGTMTMNFWTAPGVPVLLQMQGKDSSGQHR